MSRYLVRFMKRVGNSYGHESDVCQWWVETEAVDKAAAAEHAKQLFCAAKKIQDWSAQADRIHVVEADFPS